MNGEIEFLQVCNAFKRDPFLEKLSTDYFIHPNILSLQPIPRLDGRDITACSAYGKKVLGAILQGSGVDYEYKKCIFLQLVHAMKYLKNYSSLTLENILFSSDSLFVVLVDRENSRYGSSDRDTDKETLIKLLNEIFHEDRDRVIEHFRDVMRSHYRNTHALLRAPIFWNDRKKLNFLCNAFESMKVENIFMLFNQIEELSDYKWCEKLELSSSEENEYFANNKKLRADANVVLQLAQKNLQRLEHKKMASYLLGFIRNCVSHFPREPALKYFFGDTRRLWKFFAERFPDLLICTYKFVFDQNLFIETGFQFEYFESECPYSFLPRIKRDRRKRSHTGQIIN